MQYCSGRNNDFGLCHCISPQLLDLNRGHLDSCGRIAFRILDGHKRWRRGNSAQLGKPRRRELPLRPCQLRTGRKNQGKRVRAFRIPGMVGKIGNVQARNLQDVGGRRDGCPERGNKRAVYDLAKQSDSNIYKAAKRR